MTSHPFGTSSMDSSLDTEPLWTVEDVAVYLRLNPETVRVMARRGELPCVKVGKRVWRFRIVDVKEWLRSKASVEVSDQ